MATFHPSLPRGTRVATNQDGTLEEILLGPANENDGTFNLMGALRTSMATCGYEDIPSFQRAEVMVAPALQTEGKRCSASSRSGWARTAAPRSPRGSPSRMTDGCGRGRGRRGDHRGRAEGAPLPEAIEAVAGPRCRRRARRSWSSTSAASTRS